MISAIAAIFVMFGVFVLVTGLLSSSVALMGTDDMSESCVGIVKEVTPHFSHGTDGERHVWLGYEVDMQLNDKTEKVSMWVPEWYGTRKAGTEVAVAYDLENPQRCILEDVRDTFEHVVPIFVKASIAMVAVGAILTVISVTTGM